MFRNIHDSQFILYSQGCCGTYQMNDRLKAAGLDIFGPNEHNPHTRRPPEGYKGKILFMYADPRNILLSAMNHPVNYKTHGGWSRLHCRNLEGDTKYFDSPTKITVEQILNGGHDPFKLQEHFINWLTADIGCEMMMLKYEALERPVIFQDVLDFFEVKGNPSFNWKPRKSDYKSLSVGQQIQITKLFEDLIRTQEMLSPCFVK